MCERAKLVIAVMQNPRCIVDAQPPSLARQLGCHLDNAHRFQSIGAPVTRATPFFRLVGMLDCGPIFADVMKAYDRSSRRT